METTSFLFLVRSGLNMKRSQLGNRTRSFCDAYYAFDFSLKFFCDNLYGAEKAAFCFFTFLFLF